MTDPKKSYVAIVDYGMGNLFSVKRACEQADMWARITSDKKVLLAANAVILPGVGAFRDAMETLRRHDLVSLLRDVAASGKPFLGVCLGMQLLMTESAEFGAYKGLNIIEGNVLRLANSSHSGASLKVPHVGWNRIYRRDAEIDMPVDSWKDSLLQGIPNGSYMYFVHSFYVQPADSLVTLSTTPFGLQDFCSSLSRRNIFACQFHPERSGPLGLRVYEALAASVNFSKVG